MEHKKRWSVENQTVLVTGATKGIGKAIVEEFISFGANVLIVSRTLADIDYMIKECNVKNERIKGLAADLSKPEDRNKLIRWVKKQTEHLDVLVNNVGTNIRKKLIDYEDVEIDHILSTNLKSMIEITKVLYPELKKSKQASVINISSVAGLSHVRTGAIYGLTKAAIIQFTKNMAAEWAKDNIRVNAIAPWYIKTPLANTVLKNEDYLKEVLSRTPLNKIGEPEDVASIAVFLSMPAAGYITGQTINVDGGFSIYGF
jgi:Tropinone reductase 1